MRSTPTSNIFRPLCRAGKKKRSQESKEDSIKVLNFVHIHFNILRERFNISCERILEVHPNSRRKRSHVFSLRWHSNFELMTTLTTAAFCAEN